MPHASSSRPPDSKPPVEVGWVIVEPIDPMDRGAARAARDRALEWLEREAPDFSWSVTLSEREDFSSGPRAAPIQLIDLGAFERDAKGWDFTFVITGAELTGLDRRFALGATSRCEAIAVASTLRLDPAEGRSDPSEPERRERLEARLTYLFLRCFSVLNGLEPMDLGLGPKAIVDCEELDREAALSPGGRGALFQRLWRVADPRVEEGQVRHGQLSFYLQALRADPRAVPSMVWWARPWLLPLRLGRMTAAALSVLLVVMLTAEAWELGATRSLGQVVGVVIVTLVGTVVLVVSRQGLLLRSSTRLTEQIALSNVATIIALALGFVATFAFLFVVALLGASLVFGEVGARWAGVEPLSFGHHLVFAGFSAAVGIVAGALGASFEESEDFRYIARVDREL
ncbi:MAG: hypothetical protein AAFZ18_32285 [Myxococcota bacterium]